MSTRITARSTLVKLGTRSISSNDAKLTKGLPDAVNALHTWAANAIMYPYMYPYMYPEIENLSGGLEFTGTLQSPSGTI